LPLTPYFVFSLAVAANVSHFAVATLVINLLITKAHWQAAS